MDNALVKEFPPQTLEKVERLLDLLEEFGEHPGLRGKLALHGGTAINLFLLDIPRLSVDIDISYIGAIEREAMLLDRPIIERSIIEVAKSQGYSVSGGAAGHAGRTFILGYHSPWGADHVKVDCIYLNRSPLLPVAPMTSALRPELGVPMFASAELIGGKVKAFYDRVKIRDLYDISNLGRLLKHMAESDRDLAHSIILYYASLSASFPHGFSSRQERFENLHFDFRDQLLPMLRESEQEVTLEGLIEGAKTFISQYVSPRTDDEREFLERFARGDFNPALLFGDNALAEAAQVSPEAQWKLLNLKKMPEPKLTE